MSLHVTKETPKILLSRQSCINFSRHTNWRLESTLRRLHYKKCFVSYRKQTTQKHLEAEGKFEHLCFGQSILIATDNTTVLSWITKEGSMRSDSVCPPVDIPLLLQALTDHLKAWYVMCQLNVIENELSRHWMIFQSLLQEPFNQIGKWCYHLRIDLFVTRSSKLAQFVSQWMLSACLRRVWMYIPFASVPSGQSGQQNHGPQMQGNLDSPELVLNAFVL